MSSSSSVWAAVPLISAATGGGAVPPPTIRLAPVRSPSPPVSAAAGAARLPPSVTPIQSSTARSALSAVSVLSGVPRIAIASAASSWTTVLLATMRSDPRLAAHESVHRDDAFTLRQHHERIDLRLEDHRPL